MRTWRARTGNDRFCTCFILQTRFDVLSLEVRDVHSTLRFSSQRLGCGVRKKDVTRQVSHCRVCSVIQLQFFVLGNIFGFPNLEGMKLSFGE